MMPCHLFKGQDRLRAFALLLCSVPLFTFLLGVIWGQQLPFRLYDVPDGLAHSTVQSIHQDAKGYLWFGTEEGLSRFDGYRFTNYSTRDGLGNSTINAIAEDRHGHLWVGTNGAGVSRFIDDPSETLAPHESPKTTGGRLKFISFLVGDTPYPNRVNAILFDSNDSLWCATDGGLYRARANALEENHLKFQVIVPHRPMAASMAAFADSRGRLWFGLEEFLIEVVEDQIITYGPPEEVGQNWVRSVAEYGQGKVLVSNDHGVFEFIEPEIRMSRGRWKKFPIDLKPGEVVSSMITDRSGILWLGTYIGLIRYQEGNQSLYTTAEGLSGNNLIALHEDHDGNLWVGTRDEGVNKLSGETIVTFTRTGRLPQETIFKVFEDRRGHIYVSTHGGGIVEILEGEAMPLKWTHSPSFNFAWVLQDKRGGWWVGSAQGLYRFEESGWQTGRGRKITPADGFSRAGVFSMFSSQNGRIWIFSNDHNLYWVEPESGSRLRFGHLPASSISPFLDLGILIQDHSGNLWLGQQGSLGRLRNGKMEIIHPMEGLPEAEPRAFFQDSRGWLWIGLRYKGVSVTRDPAAASLSFVNYSTENGLASNTVRTIAEDDFGRIYLGTGRGLDRLDLSTGRINHFTTAEGLAGGEVRDSLKDSRGNIWVATTRGLSRFDPRAESVVDRPPPIYLSRVQVAGEYLPLAETGTLRIQGVVLPASRNNFLVEFVGLDFRGERELKYQYRLEGVDTDWSLPTDQRSVNYARLSPGSYHFFVRAINPRGRVSPEPAELIFRILGPVWQRGWFLSLVALSVGAGIYLIFRSRVAHLIELERVRTRIAADLHDDIGSGLSRIAVLSEVARQDLAPDHSPATEQLGLIAGLSREMVDSMSDIVWAINPKRDLLQDLTQRMRRFASDVFTARTIEFGFRAPDSDHSLKVGAELRREVFLIFKESINNIVRHSDCKRVDIELHTANGGLELRLSDDGKGFDTAQASDGNGMANMRLRAKRLGGELQVISFQGKGTTVMLRVPLKHAIKWGRPPTR
jgi:ligand-binding sensor domain-containing protein/signal transduction histidine kinase